MAKKTYSELLKDPRWQRKRLEILNRDGWKCQSCLDSESTLHVHHKHYHKGRQPWEYEDHELITLCEACHEGIDEEEGRLKEVLSRLDMDGICTRPAAISMLAGWAFLGGRKSQDLRSYFDEDPHGFRVGEAAAFLQFLSLDELGDLLALLQRPTASEGLERLRAFIREKRSDGQNPND